MLRSDGVGDEAEAAAEIGSAKKSGQTQARIYQFFWSAQHGARVHAQCDRRGLPLQGPGRAPRGAHPKLRRATRCNSPRFFFFFLQLELQPLLTLAPACAQLAAKCPIFNRCVWQAHLLPRP